jgi:hypothetical protein
LSRATNGLLHARFSKNYLGIELNIDAALCKSSAPVSRSTAPSVF